MTLLRGMATNRMTEDQKAELSRLSEKASSSSSSQPERLEHVNFFSELEAGDVSMPNQNKDREAEQKREQEEWEKKVGILTYLGQDTNELTGEKSWWQKLPEKRQNKNVEEDTSDKKDAKQDKFKDLVDPLNNIRKYLGTEGVQGVIKKSDKKAIDQDDIKNESRDKKRKKKKKDSKKKSKKSRHYSSDSDSKKSKKSRHHKTKKRKRHRSPSSDSSSSSSASEDEKGSHDKELEKIKKQQKLEKLRLERLEREKKARARANNVLYGIPIKDEKASTSKDLEKESNRKYNSQFNPSLAKQNKLNANKKYWLE